MSARNYDYILTVSNASNFAASNIVIGVSSQTTGLIVNVDASASTIKIKLANVNQEFIIGESVRSNSTTFVQASTDVEYTEVRRVVRSNSYVVNGAVNTFALPVSNLTNYYKDSIRVSVGGLFLPNTAWVYPAITALGDQGITFKPLHFTKTLETDSDNLKAKLSSVIKENYYTLSTWSPGDAIPETTTSAINQATDTIDFSSLVPDTTLQELFVGTQADIDNDTVFTQLFPLESTPNVVIGLAYGEVNSAPFYPGYKVGEVQTAIGTISAINYSTFIHAKNTFEQQPLVRLYTVYYPGEWYPPLPSGNPDTSDLGVAFPWPAGFPIRFAEIRGDYISDILYSVAMGGITYRPYPINSSGISLDSSSKINDVDFAVSNFDGLITQLIENAYLVGYNSTNNAPGIVNGETVFNIDPRTNPSNIHFDASYSEGLGINVAWTHTTTEDIGDTWVPLKQDSRDLLGGVVEIRTTFAHLLDFWPEYSSVIEKINGNYLKMRTTSPYRVGDIVHNNANTMSEASAVITQIIHPYLVVNNAIHLNPSNNIYIQNPDASSDEFVLDTFKVNNLAGLDDTAAKFSLTSWLQYFKIISPRRSFLKNTCLWVYKGDECQYPDDGEGPIPGSRKTANGFFTINNQTTLDPTQDVCPRNQQACLLRNNEVHFGGWPATGISVPR